MFNYTITDKEIASQIAHLLNKYNKLNKQYYADEILAVSDSYIVEIFSGIVLGCVQIETQSYTLSEIKHLAVASNMRNKGLATKLVERAKEKSKTPIVYATIREDNIGSIKTFEKCGFTRVGSYVTGTRTLFLYVTTCTKWSIKVDKNVLNDYPRHTG